MCSAVNVAEVVHRLTRYGGADVRAVERVIDELVDAGLSIAPCDRDIGMTAGALRAAHYHRRNAALSLGDCVAAATALTSGGVLVTSDGALARVALRAGVDVHPVRNSAGRRPHVG